MYTLLDESLHTYIQHQSCNPASLQVFMMKRSSLTEKGFLAGRCFKLGPSLSLCLASSCVAGRSVIKCTWRIDTQLVYIIIMVNWIWLYHLLALMYIHVYIPFSSCGFVALYSSCFWLYSFFNSAVNNNYCNNICMYMPTEFDYMINCQPSTDAKSCWCCSTM